jgi:hypothetical protein
VCRGIGMPPGSGLLIERYRRSGATRGQNEKTPQGLSQGLSLLNY